MACCRIWSQLFNTAEPTLAIVMDPPCGGVGGISESPSWNSTLSMVRPSASAATWVIEV